MNWVSDNLQILATLGSALAVYIFIRIGARRDVTELEKRMDKFENRMDRLEDKVNDLGKSVQSLDSRISRIEGQLTSPPWWEPHLRAKGEE